MSQNRCDQPLSPSTIVKVVLLPNYIHLALPELRLIISFGDFFMVELIVANEMVNLVSGLMAIHQTGMALTQEKIMVIPLIWVSATVTVPSHKGDPPSSKGRKPSGKVPAILPSNCGSSQ